MLIADFRVRYSEFSQISIPFVQAVLDEAAREVTNAGDWGARYDTAHGLLTAWKLWDSPSGATMRLDGNGDEITNAYKVRYVDLLRKTFLSIAVL